jgi:hypothetical protein
MGSSRHSLSFDFTYNADLFQLPEINDKFLQITRMPNNWKYPTLPVLYPPKPQVIGIKFDQAINCGCGDETTARLNQYLGSQDIDEI